MGLQIMCRNNGPLIQCKLQSIFHKLQQCVFCTITSISEGRTQSIKVLHNTCRPRSNYLLPLSLPLPLLHLSVLMTVHHNHQIQLAILIMGLFYFYCFISIFNTLMVVSITSLCCEWRHWFVYRVPFTQTGTHSSSILWIYLKNELYGCCSRTIVCIVEQ